MRFTTGIALLLGLSARILYNKFLLGRLTPGIEDHVLSGLWQGVALYYFIMELPGLAFGVAFGMAGRVLANLILYRDALQCACTLLGIAVGVFLTDLLSQVLEDGQNEEYPNTGYDGSVSDLGPRPRRLVQLRKVSSETSHHRRAKYNSRRRREFLEYTPSTTTNVTEGPSDTTQSLESLADWIDPNHRLSPLEREVAALRRKATIADSERRRFKEERKWAQEQGNTARANQMGWQVKRYAALMQSFHREADLRLLEGAQPYPFLLYCVLIRACSVEQEASGGNEHDADCHVTNRWSDF
ncbi:hypothetical protein K488DRAFT_50632 [Vararia minispora EC-137]|uniref:Uncharacterized protein n=1 Tax=Vararia minispora EC-137 TaxID=1314806 RepID=A0ACB8QK67_9AGAM|nr:hypothetical protein K488DRAFT_50632 [Vararia minispora EC-137]